jgi:hypothetical protein
MSLINLSSLSKRELLYHYILEQQNRGHTLPYSDLEILETWIKNIHGDCDALLLILSDVLPKYYSGKRKRVILKTIQRSVSKKIDEHLRTHSTQSLMLGEDS